MNVAKLGLAALLLSGCQGKPEAVWRSHRGPDAAMSMEAPSGRLKWVVQYPVWDRDGDSATVDSRTSIALLDVESATWCASARVDASEGLALVSDLLTAVKMADKKADCILGLDVHRKPAPGDEAAYGAIPHGHWTCGGVSPSGCVILMLMDGDNDTLATVQMNDIVAKHLAEELDRVLRMDPLKTALLETSDSDQRS